MTPVTQTRFFNPNGSPGETRGDCWAACLASLLDLPIGDVPHFVQNDVDGGVDWMVATYQWLHDRGFRLTMCAGAERPAGRYYIQTGPSPRTGPTGEAISHACIYIDGELAHDPHPDRTGLVSESAAYALEPIK